MGVGSGWMVKRKDMEAMTEGEARVIDIARRIAHRAPAKQGQNVFAALVPWTEIHDLRAALAALDGTAR